MSVVVQLFRAQGSSIPARPDLSISTARECLRREEVAASIDRLLASASGPRLTLRVQRDATNKMFVTASIDGGAARQLTQAYQDDRLDDFAGIVRTALSGWTRTLGRRLAMTVV